MLNRQLDIKELQNDVIVHWDNVGEEYLFIDMAKGESFSRDLVIKDGYAQILKSVPDCLNELGFNSVEEYLKWKDSQND